METNILSFLETNAIMYPDKNAVVEVSATITYKELQERSQRIGSALASKYISILNHNSSMIDEVTCLSATSFFAHDPIGVYMEKGIDALSSFLGIVYSGSFYAMLNAELPDARLQQIQSVLQTNIIITTIALKEKAEGLFPDSLILAIEDLKLAKVDSVLLESIRDRTIDTDPLYINFTSGSTGIPKGIIVSHRSVIDFIQCFTELFSIDSSDVIGNQAPFDFDVSVKDIYSSLKSGATLSIIPQNYFSAPVKLLDYLCETGVTTLIWAVSALCLISTFHGLEYRVPTAISKILFSGETMPYKHLREWQKHLPDAVYVNLYGPTEITCNCTYHILRKDRDYSEGIPIGKHFPNEYVFLLNEQDKIITKPGIKGEIIVRGTTLALGYYRSQEHNQMQFVQNPMNKSYPETVYRTGDWGMYDEDGELLFCGRRDNQIKHMGHRVELDEIEKNMASIQGVERCFCVFEQKKDRLKGFYIGTIEKDALFKTMSGILPPFMVPGYLRKLETIPLTKNGKIDRRLFMESEVK